MKKRIQYLIEKKFQLAFAAKFALITTLISGFIGFQLYATVWPVVRRFVPEEIMVNVQAQILFRGVIFLGLGVLLIVAISVVIFHRVAGPIFSMKRTIDRIVQEDRVEFITLRKNDELQDLAERINGLIAIIKALKTSSSTAPPQKK